MNVFSRCAAILIAMLFVSPALAAEDENVLRWSLEEGGGFRYRTEEQTSLGDENRGLTEILTIETNWRVQEDEEEFAVVAVTLDRIHFTAKGNVGNGPFEAEHDTESGTAKGRGAKALKEHFGRLAGSVIHMNVDRFGRVSNIAFPEKLADLFEQNSARELAGFFGDTISAAGVVRHLTLPLVVLPQDIVESGKSWKNQFEWALPGGVTLSGTSTYSFNERKEQGKDILHEIGVVTEGSLGRTGGERKLIEKPKGEFLFDGSVGRVREGKVSLEQNDFRRSTFEVKSTAAK